MTTKAGQRYQGAKECEDDLFGVGDFGGDEMGALVTIKQHAFTGFRAANTDRPFFFIADKAEDILQPKVTNTSETPPTVNELYLHIRTVNQDGVTFIDTRSERLYDKLQRRRLELTQATPDQPVDDEAVYLNVAGECPKGRVYDLGSLGRKKRRYVDPGASMSQMPDMVPRAKFDIVAEQLRKVLAIMHQQFGMTMDGAGLSQPPPPPPPHDQQSRRK
ncbi:hypothetical protein Syun_030763 [Stephania yunnanensis]|uniref:Uncharacterized protein n=1 Tax=Stephania yunnanensis TaxID=152371 RepID=A0AAP0HEL9_9MAGN